MKTIKIGGKEYKVVFKHSIPTLQAYKQGDLSNKKFKDFFRSTYGTTCLIVEADVSLRSLDVDATAIGMTHLSPKDIYDRRKGREFSVDYALQRSPFTYSQGRAILDFCFPDGLKYLFAGKEK